jgi:hypothetical protein
VSSLDANDGHPATGNDRDTVEWTIRFTGSFEAGDMMPLFFTILENKAEPASFVATEHFHLVAPDADAADTDSDGLSLYYETAHGLDPGVDDALLDKDEDGITNIEEQRLETAASLDDTDDDGLKDGEEIFPGADGLRTDPLVADTDGDGVRDGDDPAPLDPLQTSVSAPAGTDSGLPVETVIAVSKNTIELTASDIFGRFSDYSTEIEVSNSGGGTLNWYAESMVPGLLLLSPEAGKVQRGNGTLRITSAINQYNKPFAMADAIRVVDVSGSVADEQWISVKVGGGELQQYTVTVDIEGEGTVTSGDGQIDCGDDCTQSYDMGSVLRLTPNPAPDWKFLGWEGSPDCGTQNAVTGNIFCLARFKSDLVIFEDSFE